MLRAALLCLFAARLVSALNKQVPLVTSPDFADWRLDTVPDPNATDHLVFETVNSLLQHWPNTRMRNGHNIVPGSIPKGTLLYHGAGDHQIPPGPEWVATDPEHSYMFCRNRPRSFQQGCWHLTLVTTRPLKVVYFDGSSAVKLPYGSMDTQDLIAWGKSGSDDMKDEMHRIQDLCKWGANFGVDGFVRMEMSFEVMLCDFTSGVTVVSFANLVNRENLPGMPASTSFEAMNAGTWHDRFPGETRVQLDLSGLVTFYDTQLVPSLVDIRVGQERWDHRVQNASSQDVSAVKSRLEAILSRPGGLSSGIDWRTLVQVIVDRYTRRFELIRYLLNSTTTEPEEILDLAGKTQTQLRIMLTPYILFSATPTDLSDKTDLHWTSSVYKLCATTHTYSMESEIGSMTDSEKLLLQAVRGTSREICRVMIKMWAAGVYAGVDGYLNTEKSPDIGEVAYLWKEWTEELTRLMTWLDWNVWVKCDSGCSPEEICWLPTWPVGFPRPRRGPRPPYGPLPPGSGPNPDEDPRPERPHPDLRSMVMEHLGDEMESMIQPDPDDWIRPQPRCVRMIDPYTM